MTKIELRALGHVNRMARTHHIPAEREALHLVLQMLGRYHRRSVDAALAYIDEQETDPLQGMKRERLVKIFDVETRAIGARAHETDPDPDPAVTPMASA